MSDENKEPMVDKKKGVEEKTQQLKEKALDEVPGGGEVIHDPFSITMRQDVSSPKLYD
ncbi:MAG TPA: hypothetical protein VEJ47_08085 [Candidatus Eremiobacteraceae bacterium]|nr:hypothetical protein [Candidatus Eremiobacteraceae bacterium]